MRLRRFVRWIRSWSTTATGKAYLGGLGLLSTALIVSLLVLRWFRGLELFTRGSGSDEFWGAWLPQLIELGLTIWCAGLAVALALYALIGWRDDG